MAESRRDIPTGMPERRSRFLLVVDSNVNDLFYLSMLLQRFEYNISTAANGAEALKMAGIAAPSLVVASSVLSDMPGLELIRRMRQDPRTAVVPILVKTADRTQETERLYRQAGAAACVYEPVNAEELYRTVQSAIEPTPRQNIRIHTMLSVIVGGKPLDCVEGECASVLSEHGMYVRTLRPYSSKMRIPVQIIIKGRSIPVEAEVLYCHKFGEGPFKEPGMGLKFVRVAPQDQELIRQFIREELVKGIPG
jgi:CheY-like chemotaxis protein